MGMFFHSSEPPPERSADPALRRANLSRIGRLFAPYKLRLGGVLLLIVVSAGLGVIPAFLLKRVLEAIGRNDTSALSWNAFGMIAIAIVTGVLGALQTLLSNQVGQRVMHDLRAAVFRHLQRLSLAFFTRTRTGEVQSRISNDIGGVQNVVTNAATSVASATSGDESRRRPRRRSRTSRASSRSRSRSRGSCSARRWGAAASSPTA